MKKLYPVKLIIAIVVLMAIIVSAISNMGTKTKEKKSDGAVYIETNAALNADEVEASVRNSEGKSAKVLEGTATPVPTLNEEQMLTRTPSSTGIVDTPATDPADTDAPTPADNPGEDTPTPADTPGEDTPTPAEDTPSPADNPGEDTPTPAEDTPTPAEDTPTPAEDTPTPAEDTPTPTSAPISADICTESYNPYAVEDEAKADETAKGIDDGTVSAWKVLEGALYVGDSVTTGFSSYGFVSQTYVIADVGAFLHRHLPANLPAIIEKKPRIILLHYGVNGMTASHSELDLFITNYTNNINELKASLPDTKIIVTGIFIAPDTAVANNANLSSINAYNQRMLEMCKNTGVAFANPAALAVNNTNMFAKDGIHISAKMYTLWVNDIVKQMRLY